MPKHLVIVESPAKARTIERFLSKDYKVLASMGHIRDLPKSKLGVDVDGDFTPAYDVSADKKKVVAELRKAAKAAEDVILATDEDREGEAIAWHLAEAIKLDPKHTRRVVFHEVTKDAILEAMKHPRTIDLPRVDAQQARRVLDRLVGYKLSPFLWKKVIRGLSAGRVQSVAVRLIVEREREREAFKAEEYWSIEGLFDPELKKDNATFTAALHSFDGDKIAIDNEKDATASVKLLEAAAYAIKSVERKERNRYPAPPFITSTLQQEAARKLGYSAKKTMFIAQQLYEGIELGREGRTGLITYMRTDSTNLAAQAVQRARQVIADRFGKDYVPDAPRQYKTKAKGAQEAHEAIRPTELGRGPDSVKGDLTDEQYKLYDLIYKRTLASQMTHAVLDQTTIDIAATNAKAPWKEAVFRATGAIVKFPGFLAVYEEGRDDDNEKGESAQTFPPLTAEQALKLIKLTPEQHFTQPPPRYTEATLVKALEENGIGRPSTYAPIISTIQDRGYVRLESKRFAPEEVGKVVTDLLVEHFPQIVDIGFTADMEEDLDKIASGERQWVPLIRDFYQPFAKQIEEKEDTVSRREVVALHEIGVDPKSGKPLTVRIGRYGPYVQLGDKDEAEKPQFAAIPKGTDPGSLTVETALKLFDLPRVVGATEDGQEIVANVGRFGPYLKVGSSFVSLKTDDPYTVDEARAREVLKEDAEKKANRIIKTFDGTDVQVLNGRYGAYITDGKKNARIPKDVKPEDLTLAVCEQLLADAPDKNKRGGFKRKKK